MTPRRHLRRSAALAALTLAAAAGPAAAMTVDINESGNILISNGPTRDTLVIERSTDGATIRIQELRADGQDLSTGPGVSGGNCLFGDTRKIIVCTSPASPFLSVNTGIADDRVEIRGTGMRINASLGTGDDRYLGLPNAGNTVVDAGSGEDTVETGAGNDQLIGGLGRDNLRSNGGNDSVRGDDGDDSLAAGSGTDSVSGGLGQDTINVNGDGVRDDVFCGAPGGGLFGSDQVVADLVDVFPGGDCESVSIAAVGEHPTVGILAGTARYRGSTLRITLACPAVLRTACTGTLRALPPGRGTRVIGRTTYAVPRGARRTVSLTLNRPGALVRLEAVGPGRLGPKTARVVIAGPR